MSEKAYRKGSVCPPLKKGVLRLYSMRFCPYAQRTRLLLAHKKIPYETININLTDKPEWFLEKNPFGMVPVVEHDGKIVYESAICNDYIDDIYPENKVTPSDPYRRAKDKILLEIQGKFCAAYYKILFAQFATEDEKETLLESAFKVARMFENTIIGRGKFFGGDVPAMIDFLLYPHFERIEALRVTFENDILPKERFPNMNIWISTMQTVPAVKETIFDDDSHVAFFKSKASGNFDYDYGL